MKNFILSKLLFLLLFIPLVVLEATVEYNLTKILPPSGYDGCQVVGINENGFVTGQLTSSNHPKMKHAFIWSEGEGMRIIKPSWWQNLIQNQQIIVTDINDKNEIVGYLYIESLTCEWYPQAFIWDESQGIRLLDIYPNTPYSMANAINNKSQIVGIYKFPDWISAEDKISGFVWSEDQGLRDLSSFECVWNTPHPHWWEPAEKLIPTTIDDKGNIFGHTRSYHIFKINDNSFVRQASDGSMRIKCNNINMIAYSSSNGRGSGYLHFYDAGVERITLDYTDKHIYCLDINDNKEAVGYAYCKENRKFAFICDDNISPCGIAKKITLLNSLVICPEIDNLSSANAINNKGQIAGDADYIGMKMGFLITPKKGV